MNRQDRPKVAVTAINHDGTLHATTSQRMRDWMVTGRDDVIR